jgi:Fe2+ transport system protein FeoA
MPERRTGAAPDGVSLAELPCGVRARLASSGLPPLESKLLAAMGLALGCRLIVRTQGDPTIVEVRATRIGLARSVAARLVVVAEAATT